MKRKLLDIRVQQAIQLSKASTCPRLKVGAVLLDPERATVLIDGYNGGPRGNSSALCGGVFCERDGLRRSDLEVVTRGRRWSIRHCRSEQFVPGPPCETITEVGGRLDNYLTKYPPIKSGTNIEVGCHHAEMNCIANAASRGVATDGTWMVITAEPCKLCAKLIHHAGIVKVIVIKGGYKAASENGVDYLETNGVTVEFVEGPEDERTDDTATK